MNRSDEVSGRIESAQTLPSKFYVDPSILQIEKASIFLRTWQFVGLLSHDCGEVNGVKRTIAEPESYFTADVAGEPIVVVRDKEGILRAFSNVCRHRAGPIALGSGCRNVLRCQYHGWTYTLDGRLVGTPDMDGVEFFDRSTMGMFPVRIDTCEQFIFVNFDPDAAPLSDYLGEICAQARSFHMTGLKFAERRDYVINCNWKVYVDNYLEGYHIPIVHPGLAREIDYSQYRSETFRYHSQTFAPLRAIGAEEGGSRFYGAGETSQRALYFWIFPNLMLNIYPDNISTNLIIPLTHETTLTVFEWFYQDVDSDEGRQVIEKGLAFGDEIQREDIRICESVQRGLRSVTYDRGRYSVKRENAVHHFHTLIAEFLQSAR